jgi:hypothetical protein
MISGAEQARGQHAGLAKLACFAALWTALAL